MTHRQPGAWTLGLISLMLLAAGAGQLAFEALRGSGLRQHPELLAGAALGGVLALGVVVWQRRPIEARLTRLSDAPAAWLVDRLWLALVVWIVCAAALPVIVLTGAPEWLQGFFPRLALFWCLSLPAAACLRARLPETEWIRRWGFSTLVMGAVFEVSTFLPQISNDAFSLGWSEASRYYYASLFLASKVYGQAEPLSVLHPSRYLLQAVPFLIGNLPIWFHRVWQVGLWLGLTFAGAWLVARRVAWSERGLALWASLWLTLYFFQGAVYYHLMLAVIGVVALFRPRRFWLGLGVVGLASAWAGISRVNWIPVPGMLAVALYALEQPESPDEGFVAYWTRPVVWVVAGAIAGLAAQAVYVRVSGNPASDFGTAFSSALLWYRLLPNVTFAPGVLLALGWACLPLGLIAARRLLRGWVSLTGWRLAAVAVILLALLGGGLVVSVKIGGGGDLHNLDAFLVAFAVVGLKLGFDTRLRTSQAPPTPDPALAWWLQALLVGAPLAFVLAGGAPWTSRDAGREIQTLAAIRAGAADSSAHGRPVLFLTERQLITFGQVTETGLVPQYEKVTLMEMAMAGNHAYLSAFYRDVFGQRFGLIVSEPLVVQSQGRTHAFGEENDAWSAQVAAPVLCAYMPIFTSTDPRVQLLVPRPDVSGCTP